MPIDSLIVCDCSPKSWAVWPSPYPPDACFQAAGFLRNCDDTPQWCRRYRIVIDRAVEWLHSHGSLDIASPVVGRAYSPIWKRIFLFAPAYSDVHYSIEEQLELSTSDDLWPRIKLISNDDFVVESNIGHRIFWVTSESSDNFVSFLDHIARGLTVEYKQLDWDLLGPPEGFAGQ